VLADQAASRVQELVPIRYGRMLVSPFTFYRGAAAVMAADLAATPDSGIIVQACGDAHISNFGAFAAPDRRLVFSPNDFDETLPGPWEWDLKRMAASVEIAGRDVGLPAERRRRIVMGCVREYRDAMLGFARRSHLDVWYERLTASELVDRFGGKLGGKGRIFECQGERVVRGQRISQAASDIFLGWLRSKGLDGQEYDFYVRQLWDWKASADLSTLGESGLGAYTRACGWSLARAHARSGDRLAIAAYLGRGPSFDRALARFSAAYADQNERDHQRLADAVAAGEVAAAHGV
jgi:hypothetical protein